MLYCFTESQYWQRVLWSLLQSSRACCGHRRLILLPIQRAIKALLNLKRLFEEEAPGILVAGAKHHRESHQIGRQLRTVVVDDGGLEEQVGRAGLRQYLCFCTSSCVSICSFAPVK